MFSLFFRGQITVNLADYDNLKQRIYSNKELRVKLLDLCILIKFKCLRFIEIYTKLLI